MSDGAPRSTYDDRTLHFIGVDPGLIAGVAVLTIAPDAEFTSTLSSSEMPWADAVSYVDRWTPLGWRLRVGSERYTIPTGRSVVTAQLDAIMCNGALQWLTTLREVTFALQPRAEVKKVVTDAILKKLGWFKKTKDGHANDATRHVCFLLFSTHPELWLRLLERL